MPVDESRPTVTFTDPDSGFTYVAVSYEDEAGEERGVGADMVNHAALLLERANDSTLSVASQQRAEQELDSYIDALDLLLRLSWRLGYGEATD